MTCATCIHFCHMRTPGGVKLSRGTCLNSLSHFHTPPYEANVSKWKLLDDTASCEYQTDVNNHLRSEK